MKKVIIPATLVVLLLIVYMLIPREHNLIVKWETVKKELPVATPQIKVYIENLAVWTATWATAHN